MLVAHEYLEWLIFNATLGEGKTQENEVFWAPKTESF